MDAHLVLIPTSGELVLELSSNSLSGSAVTFSEFYEFQNATNVRFFLIALIVIMAV